MSRKRGEKLLLEAEREARAQAAADHERAVRSLRSELSEAKATNRVLSERLDERERELETYAAALAPKRKLRPIRPRLKGKTSSESTLVVLASDWHIEEEVLAKSVQHLNAYNPEIARERAERFFRSILKLLDINRKHTRIDAIVLWLGGDFITGSLHEENLITTAMLPLEAINLAGELLADGIATLLEHGKLTRIVVPCSFGNHGRLSKKPYYSKAATANLEWHLYARLAQDFESESRLEFHVTESRLNEGVEVFGRRLRFHHGEDLRYSGGLQGTFGRLFKAHTAWNQTTPCFMSFVGHWHQHKVFDGVGAINGSLIGYSAYSQMLLCEYEPPRQTFLMIEKDHGLTSSGPIFVE